MRPTFTDRPAGGPAFVPDGPRRGPRRRCRRLPRVTLGIALVWLGALTVTAPFLDAGLVVPALGAFEVILGLVLLD
jgi:hypothetical protein